MKFLLKVKENKAVTLVGLLNDLPYVKTEQLTPYKAKVLEGVKEAVDEMKLVMAGKLDAKDADALLKFID